MKKKIIVSVVASAMLFGSISTNALAETPESKFKQPTSNSIEERTPFGSTLLSKSVQVQEMKTTLELLQERKKEVTNTINSTGFSTLPTDKKLSLLNQSFQLQKDIHKEYKSELLSTSRKTDVDKLLATLREEQRIFKKELGLLEQTVNSAKEKNEKLIPFEKDLTELVSLAQDIREDGRELKEMAVTSQRNSNSSRINSLIKLADSYIKEENKKQAIETLKETISLSEGKSEYVALLGEVADKEQFHVIWNHDLVSLNKGFAKEEERHFISMDQLQTWMNVEVSVKEPEQEQENDKELKEEVAITINHAEHELKYDNKEFMLDGISIGKPNVWKNDESNNLYIDAEFIFELFGYQVELTEKGNVFVVTEAIYPVEEVDKVATKEMVEFLIK